MSRLLVTNEHINSAWGNANFGIKDTAENRRKYILCALMKCAMGYYNGFTAMSILKELRLLDAKGLPNKKGRLFLTELYDDLAYKP